jgi:hypothetical protein
VIVPDLSHLPSRIVPVTTGVTLGLDQLPCSHHGGPHFRIVGEVDPSSRRAHGFERPCIGSEGTITLLARDTERETEERNLEPRIGRGTTLIKPTIHVGGGISGSYRVAIPLPISNRIIANIEVTISNTLPVSTMLGEGIRANRDDCHHGS